MSTIRGTVEREIEAAGGSVGVKVERRPDPEKGGLAIWTIDRPDRRNALSRSVVREIGRLAREAMGDKTLRAVIVTGAGGQAFCAGADLKERQGMNEEEVRDFLSLYRVCFRDLERLDKPVIAAIDGVAFGGGLELALACDFRVASRTSQIGLTETSLGIIPGAGGTQRLVREIGASRAKELIVFARRLSAEEALSYGVVNRLADAGTSALDAAIAWAEPLLSAAPIAIASALAAVDAASDLALEDGLSFERICYERTLVSKDRTEALAAFAAKRKPVFTGE
jgi:enoyl-CoA hydratase/carnithine racemase